MVTQSAQSQQLYRNLHTKWVKAIYDGKGYRCSLKRYQQRFDAPAVLEKLIPVYREIAQIVAINEKVKPYSLPCSMIFDPLNLLDYQISPADIPQRVLWKVEAIALAVVKNLKSPVYLR